MDPNHPRPPVHPSTPPPPHILKMWKEKEKEKQKEKEKKEKQKEKEKQKAAINMKIVKRARRDTALRFYGKKHGRIWLGPLDPGLFMPCDARPDGP